MAKFFDHEEVGKQYPECRAEKGDRLLRYRVSDRQHRVIGERRRTPAEPVETLYRIVGVVYSMISLSSVVKHSQPLSIDRGKQLLRPR